MYNDLFTIGSLTIHGYGLCMGIGLIAALYVAVKRAKKYGLNDDIFYGIVFCGAIFGWGGAKLMYIIGNWSAFIASPKTFLSSSGFVVYGGITGGFISVIIYCLIKKVKVVDYLDLSAPSLAIAQGFGRLGCFLAGCCYGRETDSFIGITFKNSSYAPNGVKLMPTQLISAGGDFLNAVILMLIAKKSKKGGLVSACYLIFYSIGRFLVEFLRGDEIRGYVGALSTSQFYGIFCALAGVILLLVICLKKEKPVTEEKAVELPEEKHEEV